MPKAARARVASPPAGTALARAIRDSLPSRVRQERDSKGNVTLAVTKVNETETKYFSRPLSRSGGRRAPKWLLSSAPDTVDAGVRLDSRHRKINDGGITEREEDNAQGHR
jgi:hypothetical protein